MSKRRVVVTGVGPVTPIGIGKDTFWNNLVAGKSGIGPITQFDTTDFTVKIAGDSRGREILPAHQHHQDQWP